MSWARAGPWRRSGASRSPATSQGDPFLLSFLASLILPTSSEVSMRASFALARAASRWLVPVLIVVSAAPLASQYQDHRALTASVQQLAQRYRAQVQLSSIATSPGGRAVHALRLGGGQRPGSGV